ncbi:MAG: phosphoheptose isomerase, partial [Candidatus Omnitrophica bacterium]|nr:phosphoheptose isomerase [Candidatus Omnitrophota bacterium]
MRKCTVSGDILQDYLKGLNDAGSSVKASLRNGIRASLPAALQRVCKGLLLLRQNRRKVVFIGNGGSATIASHQAVDYWKSCSIRALAFNDPAALTCIGNDFGYEYVFQKPVD